MCKWVNVTFFNIVLWRCGMFNDDSNNNHDDDDDDNNNKENLLSLFKLFIKFFVPLIVCQK